MWDHDFLSFVRMCVPTSGNIVLYLTVLWTTPLSRKQHICVCLNLIYVAISTTTFAQNLPQLNNAYDNVYVYKGHILFWDIDTKNTKGALLTNISSPAASKVVIMTTYCAISEETSINPSVSDYLFLAMISIIHDSQPLNVSLKASLHSGWYWFNQLKQRTYRNKDKMWLSKYSSLYSVN